MKKYLFSLSLLILVTCLLSSCSPLEQLVNDNEPSKTPDHSLFYEMNKNGAGTYLPSSAVITKELGNGWVTFTLDDHEYLFFLIKSGSRSYSAVTLIN